MPLLEIIGLDKKYGGEGKPAVQDLSLSAEKGEILALLGESGSGKTTLLRLIAGFEQPDRGKISIGGQEVVGSNIFVVPEQRKVGMVFQDYALFPHLTVQANIQFGLYKLSKKSMDSRLEEVMRWVNIQGLEKKYPHQLSGGQQQRVALARALAPEPTLLLLDEPFSNLDVQLKDQVREEVRNTLKRAGTTAIFVTHDVRDALSTADRIAVVKEGKLQQQGTPGQLYQEPANAYVANFFGKTNILSARYQGKGFETVLGLLEGTLQDKNGFSGWLCLRPEAITICPANVSPLKGTLITIQYFGDHLQLLLEVTNDVKLWAKVSSEAQYDRGQTLHFKVDPSHLQVIGA